MFANSIPGVSQSTSQNLQNSLTADLSATKQTQGVEAMISQTAIEEFALRFNGAMIEMLAAQGVSATSPLSKKLRAYATAEVAPVKSTLRFA